MTTQNFVKGMRNVKQAKLIEELKGSPILIAVLAVVTLINLWLPFVATGLITGVAIGILMFIGMMVELDMHFERGLWFGAFWLIFLATALYLGLYWLIAGNIIGPLTLMLVTRISESKYKNNLKSP